MRVVAYHALNFVAFIMDVISHPTRLAYFWLKIKALEVRDAKDS